MVQAVTTPDVRELLPPLLACLPTAFISPRPPPALLPLLTPILRQRLQLLSSTSSSSTADSWLRLLSWDRQVADRLSEAVENIQIEPHPVSGEVELQDVAAIQYRRLDQETLHCRVQVEEFGLLPVYLWCMGDTTSWLLAELRTMEDLDDGADWHNTVKEADDAANLRSTSVSNNSTSRGAMSSVYGGAAAPKSRTPGNDSDDGYWAAYDATPEPGRTPVKRSPAPGYRGSSSSVQVPSTSELEYFARYMSEVQPALDPEDPDEESLPAGESTLHGNSLVPSRDVHNGDDHVEEMRQQDDLPPEHDEFSSILANFQRGQQLGHNIPEIQHPRPSSSSSSSTKSIERLERKASIAVQAEVGVKQHISTDIKSLFRLARSAGIDRREFERIVKTELDMLGMMELE